MAFARASGASRNPSRSPSVLRRFKWSSPEISGFAVSFSKGRTAIVLMWRGTPPPPERLYRQLVRSRRLRTPNRRIEPRLRNGLPDREDKRSSSARLPVNYASRIPALHSVSYTHLTLPTSDLV